MQRFVYEFTYLWLTAAPPLLLLLVPLLLLLLVPLMLLLVPLLLVPLPHLLKAVEESLLPLCPPVAVLSRTATRAAFPSATPVALWLTAASIPRAMAMTACILCNNDYDDNDFDNGHNDYDERLRCTFFCKRKTLRHSRICTYVLMLYVIDCQYG